jgi:hypothetical protein
MLRETFPRFLPLCTFVSFVVDELQMLEPQRTRRYTKEDVKDGAARLPLERPAWYAYAAWPGFAAARSTSSVRVQV